MSPSLEEYALDFVRRGGYVSPCLPKTKIAQATPNGFKDRTRDPAQVHRWWTKNPYYNVACNAGGLFDVDTGCKSLEEVLAFAKKLGLPETLVVRSGRRDGNFGAQLHYAGDPGYTRSYDVDGVTGEVRSASRNSYGLAPGSIHDKSGERYEIVVDLPIATWPAGIALGRSRLRASALLGSADSETTAYRARQTFERLLLEARRAKRGNRNATAHAVTWYAARAFLADVFEVGFDESTPPLSKSEIGKLIKDAVQPHYTPDERDVTKMLGDSWRYGFSKGRLRLDVYWSEIDKFFSLYDSERAERLLDGNTEDFPTAIAARDHFLFLLSGFDEESRKRLLRYSRLDDAVAEEARNVLEIRRLLGEEI